LSAEQRARLGAAGSAAAGDPSVEDEVDLMEQKFEGQPSAEIRLDGRAVERGRVANDWGLLLQWQISRDGKVVGTAPARMDARYEHPDRTPGNYEIVLQMWKYVDYRKDAQGEFVNSKFVDISNRVSYSV